MRVHARLPTALEVRLLLLQERNRLLLRLVAPVACLLLLAAPDLSNERRISPHLALESCSTRPRPVSGAAVVILAASQSADPVARALNPKCVALTSRCIPGSYWNSRQAHREMSSLCQKQAHMEGGQRHLNEGRCKKNRWRGGRTSHFLDVGAAHLALVRAFAVRIVVAVLVELDLVSA